MYPEVLIIVGCSFNYHCRPIVDTIRIVHGEDAMSNRTHMVNGNSGRGSLSKHAVPRHIPYEVTPPYPGRDMGPRCSRKSSCEKPHARNDSAEVGTSSMLVFNKGKKGALAYRPESLTVNGLIYHTISVTIPCSCSNNRSVSRASILWAPPYQDELLVLAGIAKRSPASALLDMMLFTNHGLL